MAEIPGRGGNSAEVVVFEPDPSNYGRLETTASLLPEEIAKWIELMACAVAGRSGTVRFSQRNLASSMSTDGEVEVPCRTLDEVLGGERTTFIKMDIEGAELQALRGATEQIRILPSTSQPRAD